MGGGKGGGGGGGKGKLGAMGEEGGKRRVLAVSFDFFFSLLFLSFVLSTCFPFLSLLLSLIPSYFFSLSFCFIISFQRQKHNYNLSHHFTH